MSDGGLLGPDPGSRRTDCHVTVHRLYYRDAEMTEKVQWAGSVSTKAGAAVLCTVFTRNSRYSQTRRNGRSRRPESNNV